MENRPTENFIVTKRVRGPLDLNRKIRYSTIPDVGQEKLLFTNNVSIAAPPRKKQKKGKKLRLEDLNPKASEVHRLRIGQLFLALI